MACDCIEKMEKSDATYQNKKVKKTEVKTGFRTSDFNRTVAIKVKLEVEGSKRPINTYCYAKYCPFCGEKY